MPTQNDRRQRSRARCAALCTRWRSSSTTRAGTEIATAPELVRRPGARAAWFKPPVPAPRTVEREDLRAGCGESGGVCCRDQLTGSVTSGFARPRPRARGSERQRSDGTRAEAAACPSGRPVSQPTRALQISISRGAASPAAADMGSPALPPALAGLASLASNALARCEPLLATRLVALAGSAQTGHVRLHCTRSSLGRKSSPVSARQPRPARIDRPADGCSRTIIDRALEVMGPPFILVSIRGARRCATAAPDRTIDAANQQHPDRRHVSHARATHLRAALLWCIVERVEAKLPRP